MSQQQSRKHFLAKLLGLGAAAVALPRAFGKQGADTTSARPAALEATPVKVAVESRAVARRNDSL